MSCEATDCKSLREYFCKDHQEVLCQNCCETFHFECGFQAIVGPEKMNKAIELVERLVESLCAEAKKYGLLGKIKGLEESLKNITDAVQKLREESNSATQNDEFLRYDKLKLEALKIKTDICSSKYYQNKDETNHIFELLFYLQLSKCSNSPKDLGETKKSESENKAVYKQKGAAVDTNKPTSDTCAKIENEVDNNHDPDKPNNSEDTYEINSTDNIQDLKQIIKELEKENSIYKEKASKDEVIKSSLLIDLEELKFKMMQLQDENSKLKRNVKELKHTIEQSDTAVKSYRRTKFAKFYRDYTGQNFEPAKKEILKLLFEERYKDRNKIFLMNLKFGIPELTGISINISENNELNMLNEFLMRSIVENISLFHLDRNYHRLLDGSKIIEGLSQALPKITKEVYLSELKLTSSDFSKILSSSAQTQRCIVDNCILTISAPLSISVQNSSMKHLGCTSLKLKSSDPSESKTKEDLFEMVLDAISKSPIGGTLKVLNIYDSEMDRCEVEERLDKYGLEDIVVMCSSHDVKCSS
ncbi:unnamed protein product [Moneuplotes crassus]|uniref:Uncharacterized protein n=1 Tax=Euplotes crassus TaxID=5936 RepID=A0AAD1UDX5_EUPCR|nr:unnamed protein product [Moneuplotes crassus]